MLPASHHSFMVGYIPEVIALAISMYDMLISSNVKLPFDKDDVILVSFIHDLEKIDRYVLTTDDWKNNGNSSDVCSNWLLAF